MLVDEIFNHFYTPYDKSDYKSRKNKIMEWFKIKDLLVLVKKKILLVMH